MRDKHPNPRALRLEPLCREGVALNGSWPLVALPRLAESFVAAADGNVSWNLQGSTRALAGGETQLWVRLGAQAVVPLQCQRCLLPLAHRLDIERQLRFVDGEELAARLDEETDDDVLCLPAALDLQTLVEDELILALPIVPRHEGLCPQPLLPDALAATATPPELEEPHPFAALAALKHKRNDL